MWERQGGRVETRIERVGVGQKEKKELQQEIFKGYKFLIPIVLVLSISIFVTRDLIIYILFTPDFSAVRDLFLAE